METEMVTKVKGSIFLEKLKECEKLDSIDLFIKDLSQYNFVWETKGKLLILVNSNINTPLKGRLLGIIIGKRRRNLLLREFTIELLGLIKSKESVTEL